MKHPRTALGALVALAAVGLGAGCETFGKPARKSPQEIVAGEIAGDDGTTTAKSKWQPGAWSSEAQDVEKSVMRNSPDTNWQK